MWTRFTDMHSGGKTKEPPYQYIYIEAPEDKAKVIFYNRFGHNPERVTCTCCGQDYSISEASSLAQATAFERGCAYEHDKYIERPKYKLHDYQTLEDYLKRTNILVISTSEIKPAERVGDVPEQGYVWKD